MHNSREAVEKVEHSAKSRFVYLSNKGLKLVLKFEWRYWYGNVRQVRNREVFHRRAAAIPVEFFNEMRVVEHCKQIARQGLLSIAASQVIIPSWK